MTERTVDEIVVDVCQGGCGGIWFDHLEMKKFDEPHEEAGQELLDVERGSGISVNRSARVKCPRCDDLPLMRHFFSVKRSVEIDECPGCAGFWLDLGELGQIRELFPSEAAKKQAAAEYFEDVFGDDLAEMRRQREETAARARRIANMFKFLCPSAYIPGKQEWGAF